MLAFERLQPSRHAGVCVLPYLTLSVGEPVTCLQLLGVFFWPWVCCAACAGQECCAEQPLSVCGLLSGFERALADSAFLAHPMHAWCVCRYAGVSSQVVRCLCRTIIVPFKVRLIFILYAGVYSRESLAAA